MRENFLLDPYLAPHVRQLYGLIRSRGLVQYFSPYLSADMRTMAERFNTTVAALEDEVSWLILDGQVQARIDSHNKVIVEVVFLGGGCFVGGIRRWPADVRSPGPAIDTHLRD